MKKIYQYTAPFLLSFCLLTIGVKAESPDSIRSTGSITFTDGEEVKDNIDVPDIQGVSGEFEKKDFSVSRVLPKTGEVQVKTWKLLGFLIVGTTLVYFSNTKKKYGK